MFSKTRELKQHNRILSIKKECRNKLFTIACNCKLYEFGYLKKRLIEWVQLHLDKSATDKLLEDTKLLSKEKQVNMSFPW